MFNWEEEIKQFKSIDEAVDFLHAELTRTLPRDPEKGMAAFVAIAQYLYTKAMEDVTQHYVIYTDTFFRVICEKIGLDYKRYSEAIARAKDSYLKDIRKLQDQVDDVFKYLKP